MRLFSCFFMLIIGLFVLGMIGCRNPDARYTKVEGVVTYKQQPVEGATVTFLPSDTGTDIEPAAGITDANGKFLLTSSKAIKGGTGILPGEYVVLISKITTPPDPDHEAFEQGKITFDEYQARYNRKDPYKRDPPPKHHLPEKYSKKDKTDLKAKVEPRKNPPFHFDLTD